MRRRTLLLVLSGAAVLAPFTVTPASPAHAIRCDDELDVVCLVGSVACRADDSLYEKSAVYRKTGGIDCLQ